MNRHEREVLLDRVEREGATVGARIPDRLEIGGEVVQLRDRVLGFHREDDPDEEAVHALTVALRGTRKERLDRLESDPELDRPTAETIADEIVGIDRALASLRAVSADEDIEEEIRRQQLADSERWRNFLKKAGTSDIDRSLPR